MIFTSQPAPIIRPHVTDYLSLGTGRRDGVIAHVRTFGLHGITEVAFPTTIVGAHVAGFLAHSTLRRSRGVTCRRTDLEELNILFLQSKVVYRAENPIPKSYIFLNFWPFNTLKRGPEQWFYFLKGKPLSRKTLKPHWRLFTWIIRNAVVSHPAAVVRSHVAGNLAILTVRWGRGVTDRRADLERKKQHCI